VDELSLRNVGAGIAVLQAWHPQDTLTDQVGERTISSFGVLTGDDGGWIAAVGRHWYLDGIAPR
jgi:hypothetical protein